MVLHIFSSLKALVKLGELSNGFLMLAEVIKAHLRALEAPGHGGDPWRGVQHRYDRISSSIASSTVIAMSEIEVPEVLALFS